MFSKPKFEDLLTKIGDFYLVLPLGYGCDNNLKLSKNSIDFDTSKIYDTIINDDLEIEITGIHSSLKKKGAYDDYYFILNQPNNMIRILTFNKMGTNIISSTILSWNEYNNQVMNNILSALRYNKIM